MNDWRCGLLDLKEPWNSAQATERIRALGKARELALNYKKHAKDRLLERGLVMGDVLHLLRHGFVHEGAQKSTRDGCFKYRAEGKTPNSGARTVGAIVIPDWGNCECKIITVMWVDE